MKKKRTGLRIILREKLQVQESELMMHRQRFSQRGKIWNLAEIAGSITKEPKMVNKVMLVAIGHSLSELVSFDDWEDGEDKHDQEIEQGKLSGDNEPSLTMGTITKMVL
jgi:hypothetical protein